MPKVTIQDEIKELKRELQMRNRLYPEWIKMCRMTAGEARHQTDCLQATLNRLEALEAQQNGEQKSLF